jgi:mannose PTS system EIID component
VSDIPAGVRWRLLLRSFLVQGSWNYEALIGTGFAFVLLPLLRHLHRDDPAGFRAAVLRHCEVFNSHPYFAPLAAGAVARLEADGVAPDVVARLKSAIRSSLGALGDQLFWLAWRPATALLAIMLLLLGLPWWLAVGAFLLGYNALHLWLRVWGLRLGLQHGIQIGSIVRQAPLARWAQWATGVAMVLAGLCAALAIGNAGPEPASVAAAALVAAAGAWLGLRVRSAVQAGLLIVWTVGILVGFTF